MGASKQHVFIHSGAITFALACHRVEGTIMDSYNVRLQNHGADIDEDETVSFIFRQIRSVFKINVAIGFNLKNEQIEELRYSLSQFGFLFGVSFLNHQQRRYGSFYVKRARRLAGVSALEKRPMINGQSECSLTPPSTLQNQRPTHQSKGRCVDSMLDLTTLDRLENVLKMWHFIRH